MWDNAKWHRAKKLRKLLALATSLPTFILVWISPYAPDHNPIEKVSNEAKAAITNRQRDDLAATTIEFRVRLGCFSHHCFPKGS